MEDKYVLNYKDHDIRYKIIDGDKWYCGGDVCKILNLSNVSKRTSSVNKKNKRKTSFLNTRGENRQTFIVINKCGVAQILSKSRKLDNQQMSDICQLFEISSLIIFQECVETQFINQIIKCFPSIKTIKQFSIDKYRIDLYLPDYKIAVECDENNHSGYDIEKEIDRQKFIEKQLGCHFVRFNPNVEDFSIFEVIGKISSFILNDHKEYV